MRISRIILLYVAAILLLALGSCGYAATRPDLLLNPISRQIYLSQPRPDPSHPWHTEPVNLVPENFAVGEPIDVVQDRLVTAGYKSSAPVAESGPSWLAPAAPIRQRYLFSIEGTTFLLSCEDFLVEVHTAADRLLSASATKWHNRCAI
jgi:hypothetical protein